MGAPGEQGPAGEKGDTVSSLRGASKLSFSSLIVQTLLLNV